MELTYLGHAGFMAVSTESVVVMDPWLSEMGANDASWFQYPSNHHLADHVRHTLADGSRARYIYISHEHRDHFDPTFLRTVDLDGVTMVIPKFESDLFARQVREFPGADVQECSDGERADIPGGYLRLYVEDGGLTRDSAALLHLDGRTFLDLNDCKIHDRSAEILEVDGHIDVLTAQFSGAGWHPTCYDYDESDYRRISRRKARGKFEATARLIERLKPSMYLPSAGPPVFLDPTLIEKNFEEVNIFPRAPEVVRFLQRRLASETTQVEEVMPGDVLDFESGRFTFRAAERVDEADFEPYVRTYAARYRDFFRLRDLRQARDPQKVLERLADHLQAKLRAFPIRDRIHLPLFFGVDELPDASVCVDFQDGSVRQTGAPETGSSQYRISAPAWQVGRVLDGHLTWDEFSLTFRIRLHREPDVYNLLVQGFLMLDVAELPYLSRQVLELESRQDRITVDARDEAYEVDRYCPHSGADLAGGWCQGVSWICPRHRMAFDLTNAGLCLESGLTVNASLVATDE